MARIFDAERGPFWVKRRPFRFFKQALDLTGHRYGKLTVLGPAENIGERTAWRCLCDCGRQAIVKTTQLRSGHTKSCGCMERGPVYVDGTSRICFAPPK